MQTLNEVDRAARYAAMLPASGPAQAHSHLQQQGFRFIRRGGVFRWEHAAEMLATDIDCTDMSDAEFEAFVAAGEAA